MCGIVGIVYRDIDMKCDESMLISMRDVQIHRGPDDAGVFLDGNMGIGHRRLSIIDLSSGHQPMSNEDGSLWIVFNGEIYNFRALREDLLKKGHVFKTECDTEVILHLYEEKGSQCVNDLNGMFAIAIWDKKERVLFLARDRMGIKPVYYVHSKDYFMFSSEIKSFFENTDFRAECDHEAVREYFMFRDVAGEKTMFKGVKRLLPGHMLVLKNQDLQISQYWSPFSRNGIKRISFEEAVEELTFLIKDAVKIRMMSDVPLGTFCSGGIDSSLVSAVASQFVNSPINTFSVGFHEEQYDETSYAKIVSSKYGTDHHEIKLSNSEFADYLPRMIWHNDEPLNYANSIHMFAISKLAKEFVTVVLTGEGADELFSGYPRYQIPKLIALYNRIPGLLRRPLYRVSCLFGNHKINKLRKNLKYSLYDSLLYNTSVLDSDILSASARDIDIGLSYRREILNTAMSYNSSPELSASLLDQHTYLVSILNRQDKMSMATSIESRVPLIDYRIVEFSNALPPNYKVNHMKGKFILKKIASKYLPSQIINRKKSGFGVPLSEWFREQRGIGALKDSLNDLTLDDYFPQLNIKNILDEHQSGLHDHSEFLWTALNFKIWRELFNI